jgi:hypothetical protein
MTVGQDVALAADDEPKPGLVSVSLRESANRLPRKYRKRDQPAGDESVGQL